MALWDCIKIVEGGFEVRLGVKGDHSCGFIFASKVTLADLVLVFGPTMIVLDVNNQDKFSGINIPASSCGPWVGAHSSFKP